MFLARHARHFVILDLDRTHGAGRARLLAAGLLPALVKEMGIERPDLRKLQFFVPPDVPVRASVEEILAPPRLLGIDEHDPVVPLPHRVAGLRHAWRVVAVIAHGRNVGDVDHWHLPALLLQDVDPFVAVLRHRRAVRRPGIADIFIHDRERAQVAIRALGHVDDHVPFLHCVTSRRMAARRKPYPPIRFSFLFISRARGARLRVSHGPACPSPCARRSLTCARCAHPTARPEPAHSRRQWSGSSSSACALA